MKKITTILTCLLLCSLKSQGQDTIILENPSFEADRPECGNMPAFWTNRNKHNLPHSGVQPGCDGVDKQAYHGDRFFSLKTTGWADDRIGQKLPGKALLEKGSTYTMSLYLAYDDQMAVSVKPNLPPVSYGNPALLRVIGYNTMLDRQELLKETYVIDHTDWEAYDLTFTPQKNDYNEIVFEAWTKPSKTNPLPANVLIDSISTIIRVKKPLASATQAGQEPQLENPSFDGVQSCNTVPDPWYNCGPTEETPPDIQPGCFQVTTTAAVGKTYMGLVVRDNNTWESLGQRLPVPLQKGRTYVLSSFLARSALYLSNSRLTGEGANYATPVVLRVWGGSDYCDRAELLAESPLITNTEWQEYDLNLTTSKDNINFLTLEAYYKTPKAFSYNGNLLIDNVILSLSDQ